MTGAAFWPAFRRTLLISAAWLVLAFLIIPLVLVIPVSLTDQPYLALPKHTLSLEHYRDFFHDPVWLSSAGQSFVIALFAAMVAVLLGALCAVGCWRLGGRASSWLRLLMLGPLIVPTIVQAIGMYRLWAWSGLYDTYLGVVVAHAIIGLPYVVLPVSAALASIDPKLEQAARNLGASMRQTVRLVIFPNILPGLFSGALLAFIASFDDLILVLFLTSRAIETLPKRIWEGIQQNVDPTVASAAMLLAAFTLIALLAGLVARRLTESARQKHADNFMIASSSDNPPLLTSIGEQRDQSA